MNLIEQAPREGARGLVSLSRDEMLEGLRMMADLLANGEDPGAVAGQAAGRLMRPLPPRFAGDKNNSDWYRWFNVLMTLVPISEKYKNAATTGYEVEAHRDERLQRILTRIADVENNTL